MYVPYLILFCRCAVGVWCACVCSAVQCGASITELKAWKQVLDEAEEKKKKKTMQFGLGMHCDHEAGLKPDTCETVIAKRRICRLCFGETEDTERRRY